MVKRPALPGPLARASFTTVESARLGVEPNRLRAGDLWTPSRMVRIPKGADQSLLDRVRPYTELTPGACASHTTAALLHGIPLPRQHETEPFIHLSRPAAAKAPRRRGVIGHECRLKPPEVVLVGGVPVTSLARTWLDLASILRLDDLVAAADHLVSEHHRHFGRPRIARVSAADLRAYVLAQSRVRGLPLAREAVRLMRVGVDSVRETHLRLILVRAGLPEFTPNFPIEGEPGEAPVWTDLGCQAFKVCGEYEGWRHLTPEKQSSDRLRDRLTAERGWRQVKIYADDMRNGDAWVAAHFEQALWSRGWRP
ncbi:hypothetical protein [Specibacter cremeus]|uniref:hypothetical protein n=1 Tax=Specibacter cremeus TaxID=1629051 RepID=UPI001F0C5618|nr:hypothetical protein [Specibacter cremeus]